MKNPYLKRFVEDLDIGSQFISPIRVALFVALKERYIKRGMTVSKAIRKAKRLS